MLAGGGGGGGCESGGESRLNTAAGPALNGLPPDTTAMD